MKLGLIFRLIWLLVYSALALYLPAQSFVWALGEGGIGNEAANGIAADEDGNVYITGNLAGQADFSGTVYQGRGVYDVIIVKYDAQGHLVWLKTAGGSEDDQGNAIRYRDGFLYVGGYFTDTAWFENTQLIGRGSADAFVAKYDLNGNLIWVRAGGGPDFDYTSSLDVDAAGNVYTAGSYKSSIQFDTIQLSTTNLFTESFYCKYDAVGHLLWAKSTHGNNANQISGLAHDRNHSFYVTGFFGSDLAFGQTTVSSNTPSYDIFLARLDDDGNLKWLNRAGSNYEDAGIGVAVDFSGNPVVTGYFSGNAQFGTNTVVYDNYNDVFTAKYDTAGNNLWVRAGKGQQLDVGYSVATDSSDHIFVTGMFQGAADFDGHIVTGDDRDIFLVSYNPDGNLRWIDKAGGQNTDCGLGITVVPGGNVAICGYYLYTCSFGNIAIDYALSNDLFVAEYTPPTISALPIVSMQPSFSVYPNPVDNQLWVNSVHPTGKLTSSKLYDLTGRLLLENEWMNNEVLNTSNLNRGCYYLLISNGLEQETIKIIKH